MLRRNCILEEIPAGDGLRGHRCLVCGRRGTSKYPPDRVHLMCQGTLEEFAAWRETARARFLDYLDGAIELAGQQGRACRSYDEVRALYTQCEACPDWQVTLCRRLKCPARPQKYLRLLTQPGERCAVWRMEQPDPVCTCGHSSLGGCPRCGQTVLGLGS
jgi:hypothetical protein